MQELANTHSMRNEILSLMAQHGLENDCYLEMLDYTIDLFDSQGLGTDYYGYHNINHELEVTYVSLLALDQKKSNSLKMIKSIYMLQLCSMILIRKKV